MLSPATPIAAEAAKCPSPKRPLIPQAATSSIQMVAAAPTHLPIRSSCGAAGGRPAAAVRRQAVTPSRTIAGRRRSAARTRSDDLGPLIVEAELDLHQPSFAHRPPDARLLLRVEHQEPAAAGADQLAADRAVVHRQVVPAIDVG